MIDKVIENNRVSIIGEIVSEFKFSHEVFGEGFYTVDVSVDRLSELTDVIPLMVSERLVDVSEDYQGRLVEVSGDWSSDVCSSDLLKYQVSSDLITVMKEQKTS